MRVEESVDIARPPADVWAFVSDPMNDMQWCSKVQSVEPIGERRWRVMHKPIPMRPPQELIVEHRELEPEKRLTMHEEDEGSTFDVQYRLEPCATGTRFTQVSEFEWKRLPRPVQAFLKGGVRRDVRNQLRALKRLLEAAPS
jgi:carbon monoxide dehydrogenase subunit G